MLNTQAIPEALLIVDYNLTRFNDVKQMSDYARQCYGLKTVLIRPNPTSVDHQIADQVIALDPRSAGFVEEAYRQLKNLAYQLKAGLVFSDNAVYSGACLLQKLGLLVDAPELADAAFSKIIYRQRELKYKTIFTRQNIFIPEFSVVYSLAELKAFAKRHMRGFVLKPACEGNNRGVIVLNSQADLKQALNEVRVYIKEGLICEQFIPFEREYSFDGLAHLEFITEKWSVDGRYPVEKAQIVPAQLSESASALIKRAGLTANFLTGQLNGPFHNEIKLNNSFNKTAIVEPNRRPAGMKIWTLAEKVYGLNLYHLWIDKLMGVALPTRLPDPKGFAAMLMLGVPHDGTLYLNEKEASKVLSTTLADFSKQTASFSDQIEWFGFQMNVNSGTYVESIPKDNACFIAQIGLYVPELKQDMKTLLATLQECWLNNIGSYIAHLNYVVGA